MNLIKLCVMHYRFSTGVWLGFSSIHNFGSPVYVVPSGKTWRQNIGLQCETTVLS